MWMWFGFKFSKGKASTVVVEYIGALKRISLLL
jgi:hypothetical protein